jgi:hypothetical protein
LNPSWFSLQTIGGAVGALAFAVVCYTNMRAAILVFTAVGCVTAVQIGAFAGNEMVTGLLPVELLATVMIAVWTVRQLGGGRGLRTAPFNAPLLLLIPVSFLSLMTGFTWFDPSVPLQNMKVAVSVGQILLLVWPIGTYIVVANSVHDDRTIQAIRNIIVVLALPSLLLIASPQRSFRYVEWSMAFALPASSLCFAEFFHTRSFVRRAGLLLLALAPIYYGFVQGKAFFYAYVIVSTATITWLMARRVVFLAAPFAFAAYVVAVPLASDSLTPAFMRSAVETESAQQSLGGDGGRDALIRDGLSIWSRFPILGVGPGNNYPYMLRYSTLGTAHNQYVNLLMELGVIGFLCFVVFAVKAARMGLRLWRTAQNPLHEQLALGWLGLFAAMVVGGMFGDFMLPSIRNGGLELFALFYVQWILLGILVSMTAIERGYRAAA